MVKCAYSSLQLHFFPLLVTHGNLTLLPRAVCTKQSLVKLFWSGARVVMGTLGRGVLPARGVFLGTPSVGVGGIGGSVHRH